jgi:hypothetical protein
MSADAGNAQARRSRPVKEAPAKEEGTARVGLWVGGVAAAITALLLHAGWTTGEWRGVVVSEVQVLVEAAVTYFGLRSG